MKDLSQGDVVVFYDKIKKENVVAKFLYSTGDTFVFIPPFSSSLIYKEHERINAFSYLITIYGKVYCKQCRFFRFGEHYDLCLHSSNIYEQAGPISRSRFIFFYAHELNCSNLCTNYKPRTFWQGLTRRWSIWNTD